jgi:hypothetical protein
MANMMKKHPFDDLIGYKQISLVTFRKNGTGKATTVDFVRQGDYLYVNTWDDSYKVKRLRNNDSAEISPCTFAGEVKGDYIKVKVRILPKEEEKKASKAMDSNYNLFYKFILGLDVVIKKAQFWKKVNSIYLEIMLN